MKFVILVGFNNYFILRMHKVLLLSMLLTFNVIFFNTISIGSINRYIPIKLFILETTLNNNPIFFVNSAMFKFIVYPPTNC